MSFTVFSYNATVLLIQPNPTHVLENATQPNPWQGRSQGEVLGPPQSNPTKNY